MLQIPVFHVNGEDLEACAQTVRLAVDFRQRFQRDVVIDLVCYRKHGHNEGDEPTFTQPVMYRAIQRSRSLRQRYAPSWSKKVGSPGRVDALSAAVRRGLEEAYQASAKDRGPAGRAVDGAGSGRITAAGRLARQEP